MYANIWIIKQAHHHGIEATLPDSLRFDRLKDNTACLQERCLQRERQPKVHLTTSKSNPKISSTDISRGRITKHTFGTIEKSTYFDVPIPGGFLIFGEGSRLK